MANIVKLKNSVTTSSAPVTLEQGELAINITDKRVWVGNAALAPVELFGTGANFKAGTVATNGYTVATLPAGTIGQRAYVTDATGRMLDGTITGGGTEVLPVFFNGSTWILG
jgi:hypothetical protein